MLLRQALESTRLADAVAHGRLAEQAGWHVLTPAECEAPGCGAPIDDERRRLVPGVRLCNDCAATLHEGCGR